LLHRGFQVQSIVLRRVLPVGRLMLVDKDRDATRKWPASPRTATGESVECERL